MARSLLWGRSRTATVERHTVANANHPSTSTAPSPVTRTYNYALSDSPVRIGTGLVSASGALTRTERLGYGPTGLLEQRTNDQSPVYPVADATGGLIAELPEQGQAEALPELDPWGVPVQAAEPPTSIADEKSFGFLGAAGRIEMPDSELTKLGARYYDAEVGAFLSVDPVVGEPAEPARRTPYTYGLSSPARFVDVDGRSAADAWKSAKKFVNEKASAVQERAAEITNDPNASWLAKASVVPIGLLSSLGTSENLADTLMAIAPIPGPGKLKGLGKAGELAVDAVKGASGAAKGLVKIGPSTYVGSKIVGQMNSRGWTRSSIMAAIREPTRTVSTRDTRHLPGGAGSRNDPAVAYYAADGHYVVRNSRTGEIVQISNRNKKGWKAPWD